MQAENTLYLAGWEAYLVIQRSRFKTTCSIKIVFGNPERQAASCTLVFRHSEGDFSVLGMFR